MLSLRGHEVSQQLLGQVLKVTGGVFAVFLSFADLVIFPICKRLFDGGVWRFGAKREKIVRIFVKLPILKPNILLFKTKINDYP